MSDQAAKISALRHPETREAIWLEAQPVLDLLERFRDLPENCAQIPSQRQRLRDEASMLLREHGRLP